MTPASSYAKVDRIDGLLDLTLLSNVTLASMNTLALTRRIASKQSEDVEIVVLEHMLTEMVRKLDFKSP